MSKSLRRSLAALILAVATVPHAGSAEPIASNPRCNVAVPDDGTWQQPVDDGLRVATFNVLHGLDDDPAGDYPSAGTLDARIAMQADQLAAAGVDLVGMQEVSVFQVADTSPVREVASDLAEGMAERTGERWWWCWYLANPYFTGEPDVNDGGGGPVSDAAARLVSAFTGGPYAMFKEGVAVLSRYEILDSDGLHLPGRLPVEVPLCLAEAAPSFPSDPAAGPLCAATAGFERRAALWVRAATPQGPVDLTTTHLAHDITSASDVSSLEQAAAAVSFADAHARASAPAHAFFVCDCNAQPSDEVPVVGMIESMGWRNTFDGACSDADTSGCTAGRDVIVTHGPAPAREMTERLDYVFARAGTCTQDPSGGALIVKDATGYTDMHGAGWLYPSDHIGVAADVAAC